MIFERQPMGIREIVDQYHDIQSQLRQWIDEVLDPQIAKCNSMDELLALKWEIAQQFGGTEVDYRFPSIIHVHFALHSDRFFQQCLCGAVPKDEHDGIICTKCELWFCDNCYDTTKGDGCHCH